MDLERSDASRSIALRTSHSRISWTRWDCSSDDRMHCYGTIDRTASVLARVFSYDLEKNFDLRSTRGPENFAEAFFKQVISH